MEDNLNFKANGRRPQLLGKWKTTSILRLMEDDLNLKANGRRTQFFYQNVRQPHFFCKMEDHLHFKVNGRRPQFEG